MKKYTIIAASILIFVIITAYLLTRGNQSETANQKMATETRIDPKDIGRAANMPQPMMTEQELAIPVRSLSEDERRAISQLRDRLSTGVVSNAAFEMGYSKRLGKFFIFYKNESAAAAFEQFLSNNSATSLLTIPKEYKILLQTSSPVEAEMNRLESIPERTSL